MMIQNAIQILNELSEVEEMISKIENISDEQDIKWCLELIKERLGAA